MVLNLIIAGLISSSAPTDSVAAAIVPLVAVNVSSETVDLWTSALAEALSRQRNAPVLSGAEVREGMGGPVSPDCPARPDCPRDLRARLGVGPIVFLVLSRLGTEVNIDATLRVGDLTTIPPPARGTAVELERVGWWMTSTEGWLPEVRSSPSDPAALEPLPSRPRWPSWPTWTAAAVGVGALGVGAAFGVAALDQERNLVGRGCLAVSCPADDIDALETHATVADVLYGVGAFGVVAALVLYLAVDLPAAPTVGPDRVGLVARF